MANPAAEARAEVKAAHPEAVVVERRRNSIRHRLADAPDGRQRFALDCSIGPLHYGPDNGQEIDTAFQLSVAPWDWEMTKAGFEVRALSRLDAGQVIEYRSGSEWVRFQPMALQYSNDLDQIQPIAMPEAVQAAVEDDTLTWADGYGPGRSLSWQAQTARLAKLLTVQAPSDLPPVEQYILDGGNPVLELNLIFAFSGGVTPYANGQPWGRGGQAQQRETQGLVEFRDGDGKVLWWFNLPRSWDAEGEERLGTLRFKKQGNSLYVSHRVPLSFVQGAAYPLTVDVTIDEQVGSGDDDAHEQADGTNFDGTTTIAKVIRRTDADLRYHSGLRWTTVAVLQGATIDAAYVELYSYQVTSDDMHSNIRGNDVDDAVSFVTDADVTSRARTTASVAWDGDSLGVGFVGNNIEIKTVIKEIVDRGSWASGNALCLLIDGQTGANAWFYASTHERNSGQASKLHIEYTEAGGITVTPPTATLSLTTFAPTAIIGTVVTPGVLTLSLATFTPIIGLSVIPPPLALSLATFAPTVTTTGAVTVTPGVIALSLATFAPVIKIVVTPPTLVLNLQTFVPTISTPRLVTPPTATLSLAVFAPTVSAPRLVTPGVLSLSISVFAPTVTTTGNVVVTPDILILSLSLFAPTVSTPRLVTPGLVALSLTPFTPTITVAAAFTAVWLDTGSVALLLVLGGSVSLPRAVNDGTISIRETEDATI